MASGRIPGFVGALRVGDQLEVRAGGRRAVEPGSAPMTEDTLFRIASLTKPLGGALTLGLVQEGVLALDDPIRAGCLKRRTSASSPPPTHRSTGPPGWSGRSPCGTC